MAEDQTKPKNKVDSKKKKQQIIDKDLARKQQQVKKNVSAELSKHKTKKKVASAEDFVKHFREAQRGYNIELPVAGLVIRVSTPDITRMVLDGTLPKDLLSQALQMKGIAPKTPANEMSKEDLEKMTIFLDKFFCSAVKEPNFAVEPEEGEVDVSLIDIADKLFIVELISRGMDAIKNFR